MCTATVTTATDIVNTHARSLMQLTTDTNATDTNAIDLVSDNVNTHVYTDNVYFTNLRCTALYSCSVPLLALAV